MTAKQQKTNNDGNSLLELPVLHLVCEFLSTPESLSNLAQTCTTALEYVKRIARIYSRGLAYSWKEITYGWQSYTSGMVGDGTIWNPYRVEWDTLQRHLMPVFSVGINLQHLFKCMSLSVNEGSSIRHGSGPWIHHIIDFKLPKPIDDNSLLEVNGMTLLDVIDPFFVHINRLKIHLVGEEKWYVGHATYDGVPRLIFGERVSESEVVVLPGDVVRAGSLNMFYLAVDRAKSNWGRIKELQRTLNFNEQSCADFTQEIFFLADEIGIELWPLSS